MSLPTVSNLDNDAAKKRFLRPPMKKRAHSGSPAPIRPRTTSPAFGRKTTERRCHSLSSSLDTTKKSLGDLSVASSENSQINECTNNDQQYASNQNKENQKDHALPQCVVTKIMRILATKKREFMKIRKTVLSQQNLMLEQYAAVKDLEARAGITSDESTGEIRILSATGWPAHDILLLVRDELETPLNTDISGLLGPQILQQLHAQLNPIPDEVMEIGIEILARRNDILNLLRGKHRTDRVNYLTNLEWKAKNNEFDQETEDLQRLISGTVENLKAKLGHSLNLAKIAWLDRDVLVKKNEKLQKDNMILQHKVEDLSKKAPDVSKDGSPEIENTTKYQTLCEELAKEKAAREALKDVVQSAESMLRVARARIATLERQLKDSKAELDAAKKKQKELEQQCKHRETSYDARSKKLLEVSKIGEMTIEALSRQRDALELRVKELREQAENAEKQAEVKQAEQKSRVESLQVKVAEQLMSVQEKNKKIAEMRTLELEAKVKELEDLYEAIKERSVRLVDMERRRCLEYIPSKESEPSDRETEIWKELQVTRLALSKAEEELHKSRADKDSFLNSLSRIAQGGEDAGTLKDKMATELLEREQKIMKLQHVIEEQRDNEKLMEESMTQYENQLAALRLEVKRLRNYDCYSKEIPYQDLQTELLDLHMQVETLSRERTALVTAAASRALMLERHERAAELFAKMTRVRRDLAALIDGRTEPPNMDEVTHAEVSRSLSSVCANASNTWTALRAERARVLRLESAVLAQNLQLERESRVRTQLERRRAMLERELLRTRTVPFMEKNSSFVFLLHYFCYLFVYHLMMFHFGIWRPRM